MLERFGIIGAETITNTIVGVLFVFIISLMGPKALFLLLRPPLGGQGT